MKIDANLLNEFAKITNDKTTNTTPKYVYGTVVKTDGGTFVELDGSTDGIVTPVSMVMDADDGDRVLCSFDNHSVTVVGNLEHPAQSLSSDSAYSTIEKIVGGMTMTSDGVKVFYQEDEPADSMELPLNPGDTWYKTDPSTGRAFTIYIYTEDHEWVETALTINAVNITGKLTANQIDTKELVVEDANIKSINGNKIEEGTLIAAALSHEAILTASGIKVYYQPEEPTRALISNTVDGVTTSWYEDEEGHIMRDGDTWYKTMKIANDSKDYCQIVYVYNSSDNSFEETPLDAAVLRENSITAREIDVDTLAANEAFMKKLVVGVQVGSSQILRGTNSFKDIATSGTWDNSGWRYATLGSTYAGRSRVVLSDSPNPLYIYGFHIIYDSTYTKNLDLAQDNVPVCVGETYTLSAYVKGNGTARFQYGAATYKWNTYKINTETWQKIYFTFTIDSTSVNTDNKTNIYFGIKSGDIYFACIKLEKGNVATEWSEYEGDTSVENIYKSGTTIIDNGKIDTDSLIAKNVLVKDSDNNDIFIADSLTNTVKIGDITVTTDLLDTLTNAIRLVTGKALVVDAANLTIDAKGTITATNGSFTGKVTATSGSFTGAINATSGTFKGSISAGSIISGATITGASGEFTKKFKVWVPMFSDLDDDHFVISAGSEQVKIGSDTNDGMDGCMIFSKGGKGVNVDICGLTVNISAGIGGVNIGDNTITQTKGTKGYVLSADGNGDTVWKRPLARKTCTADNISISAGSYKSGTISVTATSGYEIFAVGGFSLGNASSSGTGSSNCTVSICSVSSAGSRATVAYQINTWSSTAVKVKLVVHCLERPI